MADLSSTSIKPIKVDRELLMSLLGRRLSAQVQTLCFVGAHRYQEAGIIDWIFPSLRSIYLFEPLPPMQQVLRDLAQADPRIKVLPYALADTDGEVEFNVTTNDGESSSLLPLGRHATLFPEVGVNSTINVQARRLDGLINSGELKTPDLLILDVQGAEYQVLASLPAWVIQDIRLIYTEVSTEPVYTGSRPLRDIESLFGERFVNIGYAPIFESVPSHGNAVFVRRQDVGAALGYTAKGHLRRLVQRVR